MKKNEDGTYDFGADPAVQEELDRGRQQQARRRMNPEKRDRAARQAEIDAKRNRRNIDIPVLLEQELEKLAADLSVPFSQLLCRLAVAGLETLDSETLIDERLPSRSMRFEYVLPLPDKYQKRVLKTSKRW